MFDLIDRIKAARGRPSPPLTQVDPRNPYSIERQGESEAQSRNLVILAFSGGGTRAAAFSYGVLEALRP